MNSDKLQELRQEWQKSRLPAWAKSEFYELLDEIDAERTAREQAEARMKRLEDALQDVMRCVTAYNSPIDTVYAMDRIARKALEVQQ